MAAAFALGAGHSDGHPSRRLGGKPVHANYKQAIVDASASVALSFRWADALSAMCCERPLAGLSGALDDLYIDGQLDLAMGSAGESTKLVHAVIPVDAIVENTVTSFWPEIERSRGGWINVAERQTCAPAFQVIRATGTWRWLED